MVSRLPNGTLPVGIGLAVLGLMSYAFLAVAARALNESGFAELSVVWTVLFTLGPGVFLPLEQEIARRVAVTTDRRVWAVVLQRSLAAGGVVALLLTVFTIIASVATNGRLLDNRTALLVAMIFANLALAPVHASRGYLAGTGQFRRYGVQLALDGTLRAVFAVVLWVVAVHSPAPFGWILVGTQLIAVVATVWGTHPPLRRHDRGEQREPHIRDLARGIGWMLTGTLAAQILANAGPVVVKVLAAPGDESAGHFLTALVLARVPLFLFAALQASLLPRLAKLFEDGNGSQARAAMNRLLVVLAAVGALITAVLSVAGPTITQLLFGAGYRSGRLPLVLLSAGCTVYMLAASVAQVLLALHKSRAVAVGWWLGVAGFAAAVALPSSLPVRVSLALIVGAAVAGVWFALTARHELRVHAAAHAVSGQLWSAAS